MILRKAAPRTHHRCAPTLTPNYGQLASCHGGLSAVQTVVYLLFWFALAMWLWRSIRARRPLKPFDPSNYVDVLFIDKVDPVVFQHSGATWSNPNFGRFHFNETSLPAIAHPFVFIVNDRPDPFCERPQWISDFSELKVGICH